MFIARRCEKARGFTMIDPADILPPGLLELPPTPRSGEQLKLRSTWAHATSRLSDHAKVARSIRDAVEAIVGVQDEVLADMVLRHVRARLAPCAARTYALMHTHARALPSTRRADS